MISEPGPFEGLWSCSVLVPYLLFSVYGLSVRFVCFEFLLSLKNSLFSIRRCWHNRMILIICTTTPKVYWQAFKGINSETFRTLGHYHRMPSMWYPPLIMQEGTSKQPHLYDWNELRWTPQTSAMPTYHMKIFQVTLWLLLVLLWALTVHLWGFPA